MNLLRTSTFWAVTSLLTSSLLFATPAHADVPNEPPSVSITSPTDGQMFDGPVATIDVVVDTFSGDEGIDSVRLLVDDTPVLIDNDTPYEFTGVEIDEGMHTLTAVVVSAADGGEYPSDPVEIVVLAAADETASGESSAGESSAGESSAGESSGGSTPSTKGCSVASGTQIGAGLVLICLFGLSFSSRRRED
jgi:hypothetical protein